MLGLCRDGSKHRLMNATQEQTISADNFGQWRIIPVARCEHKHQNQERTQNGRNLQVL